MRILRYGIALAISIAMLPASAASAAARPAPAQRVVLGVGAGSATSPRRAPNRERHGTSPQRAHRAAASPRWSRSSHGSSRGGRALHAVAPATVDPRPTRSPRRVSTQPQGLPSDRRDEIARERGPPRASLTIASPRDPSALRRTTARLHPFVPPQAPRRVTRAPPLQAHAA